MHKHSTDMMHMYGLAGIQAVMHTEIQYVHHLHGMVMNAYIQYNRGRIHLQKS